MKRKIYAPLTALCVLAIVGAAVLIGAGTPAAAANVVANPDFDTTISNWTVTGGLNVTPIHDPSIGNPNPGSYNFVDSTFMADTVTVDSDCIPSLSAGLYDFSAWFLGIVGNDAASTAQIDVLLYATPNCPGAPTTTSSPTTPGNGAGWAPVSGTGLAIAANQSARVRLSFTTPAGTASKTGNWDTVVLNNMTPTPTATPTDTPVPPTSTATPTDTPTPTATNTPAPPTSTPTDTATPTQTNTPGPTNTATNTPLATDTPTVTNTPGPTNTPGSATTATDTPVATSTAVATSTSQPAATATTEAATSTSVAGATQTAVAPPGTTAPVGPPPASGIDPSNGGDVAGAGDASLAEGLPDTGTGGATGGSNNAVALLIALLAAVGEASIFAAIARGKPARQ